MSARRVRSPWAVPWPIVARSLSVSIAVAVMLGCGMLAQASLTPGAVAPTVLSQAADPSTTPMPMSATATLAPSALALPASPTPLAAALLLATPTSPAAPTADVPQTQTVGIFLPLVTRHIPSQIILGSYSPITGTAISYWLYLPADYANDPAHPWPLVLFLHGIGERGSDPHIIPNQGLPKLISQGQDFPFILLAPQAPTGLYWTDVATSVIGLLDKVQAEQAVDSKRIYLTGISMGGYGAADLAEPYAARFAALVPIAGGYYWDPAIAWQFHYTLDPTRPPPDSFCVVHNIPTWLFAGMSDNVIPYVQSVTVKQKLESCGGAPQLTLYPGVGHIGSWEAAYAETGLYTWMLSQSK